MSFNPYYFQISGKVIYLKHTHPHGNQQTLNVNAQTNGLTGFGGFGVFAQWRIALEQNKQYCKFQSVKTGKYIRMGRNGVIDVTGNGGPFTLFKISRNKNEIKLESDRFPGNYIAVNNKRQIVCGKGGIHCRLYALQPAQIQPKKVVKVAPFSLAYQFLKNNTVVLRVPGGKTLFTNNQGALLYGGGTGKFAQFNAVLYNKGVVGFGSVFNGKYIRIAGNNIVDCKGIKGGPFTKFRVHMLGNGKCKLQSLKFPGLYINVFNTKVGIGKGGNLCVFHCLKNGNNNIINNNKVVIVKQEMKQQSNVVIQPIKPVKIVYTGLGIFKLAYLFAKQNTIIIKSLSTNKALRVAPMNKHICGGNGGDGALAQWICTPLGFNLFQFKNINTQKYLRIFSMNGIDVKGIGGNFTKFRLVREGGNIVKFESNHFKGKYIAVHKNGTVKVGFGGGLCKFTCWRAQQQQQQKVIIIKQQPTSVTIVCPKCNGMGYWGTFGACKIGSIHKKIACPCCNGIGKINSSRTMCFKCDGKGFMGTFGACEWQSIHKKGVCLNCRGRCYV